jgi:hypothetical protein
MALAGNIGVDTVHSIYVPFYQGFVNRVTLITEGPVFFQPAVNGEVSTLTGNLSALRGAGASIVLTEPMYFKAEAGGQELNSLATPEVKPIFIGTTPITSTATEELLQKLLVESRVHNQLLAEANNLAPVYLAPAESRGL